MTSSWLSRACVVVVVVAVWSVDNKASAFADDRRRTMALSRLLTRLCDAILAGDDDVIDDRKREWGDNTMMSWGKRDVFGNLYALSVCELLQRNRRLRDEHAVTAWEKRNDHIDMDGTGWSEDGLKVADKPSAVPAVDVDGKDNETTKRKWGENTMATWGKRKWGENSMATWGKRDN